jgi:hypothetical protein
LSVHLSVHSKTSFISNDEWPKELFVLRTTVNQPPGELHAPSVVLRKELMSDVHAVRVHSEIQPRYSVECCMWQANTISSSASPCWLLFKSLPHCLDVFFRSSSAFSA